MLRIDWAYVKVAPDLSRGVADEGQVSSSGSQEHQAGAHDVSFFGLLHVQRRELVEAIGEHLGVTLRHVQRDRDRDRKVRRELWNQIPQRLWPSRGNADHDDL